jgi:hypothetical protein
MISDFKLSPNHIFVSVCFLAESETLLFFLLQSDSGLAVSDPTRSKEMTAINSVSNKHPTLKRYERF